MEWLKQQHRALWRFYREEFGESLLITAAAFLVICLLAFGVGLFFKSLPDTIISYFQEMIQLEGLIDEDGGINLLALFGKFFSHDKKVYNWVISLTLISALYDLLRTLPAALRAACHLDGIIEAIGSVLPLAGLGLGWICPAAVGLVIGLVAHSTAKAKKQTA